jgi:hypothetical protein
MTPKENQNENLPKLISGKKKLICNALVVFEKYFYEAPELCMCRPWVTHSKIGNPWDPMDTHWVNCKYLFSNQILSDKMHII